jgi:YD repeat-containing protein
MNDSRIEISRSLAGTQFERKRFQNIGRASALAFVLLTAAAPFMAHAGSVSYTYDTLGRLAKVIYDDGKAATTIAFSYDAAGNRTSVATTSATAAAAAAART